MNALIVAATMQEVQPLIGEGAYVLSEGVFISSGRNTHVFPDILISGPGMVNTLYRLTKILTLRKYDLIVNAGIAGSFDRSIPLGEVVNVQTDCFSELGAEDGENFISVFEMGLMDKDEFPFVNGELQANFSSINDVRKVKGITVNKVHGNETGISKIRKQFNPEVESMEGAAVFFTALMEGLFCVQFRAISNYVERRNREVWDIPLAIANLNRFLIDGIEQKYFNVK
jgi:futalosine hydrolase